MVADGRSVAVGLSFAASLRGIGAHNYLHATRFCIMLTEPPVTQEIELDCEQL